MAVCLRRSAAFGHGIASAQSLVHARWIAAAGVLVAELSPVSHPISHYVCSDEVHTSHERAN